MMKRILILFLVALPVFSADRMEKAEEMRSLFGLSGYSPTSSRQVKIAVIDNGFSGVEKDKGYLPDSAVLVEKYDPELIKKFDLGDPNYNLPFLQTTHGRVMAQIVWAMTGFSNLPKFYLLNGNGMTGFRRAVRYAIEEKVDIILYSQNRECCGDFDGRGFLNDIVSTATRSGILWINAAGNYGGQVYNGRVTVGRDGWLNLGNRNELRLKSHLDDNTAEIILNWSGSSDSEDSGTEKDLDLYVVDENDQVVGKSELKQVLKKSELAEGETYLSRERIKITLGKSKLGNYGIRIKAKSRDSWSDEKIRIVVIPERPPVQNGNDSVAAVQLLDATAGQEIMVPADHPDVITVGDLSPYSAKGPTMDGRVKPEILLERSDAQFTNGEGSSGTSNAAAYFAGIAVVLKSLRPGLGREAILRMAAQGVSAESETSVTRMGFSQFSREYPGFLERLDNLLLESPVVVGKHREGQGIVGISGKPERELTLCSNAKSTDRLFLTINRNPRPGVNDLVCYRVHKDSNQRPWYGNSRLRPGDFIEVREAAYLPGSSPSSSGPWLWRTPRPENLERF